jgi:hypothetical protein
MRLPWQSRLLLPNSWIASSVAKSLPLRKDGDVKMIFKLLPTSQRQFLISTIDRTNFT